MARPTTVHWHVLSSIREAADVEGIKIDVKVCADMEHPRISDDGERTLDGVRRLVMVNDRRSAPFERFERTEFGRPFNRLKVECLIEAPPHQIEDLLEASGRARRCRHPPSESAVEVVMGAHHARSRDRHGSIIPLRSACVLGCRAA